MRLTGLVHAGFLSGRSISSYVGTWVLSRHDSRAAPQTVQTASPVCGTKNFSSVRLYSAPQLHCTIVAIPGICASDRRFSSPELCHNRTDPLPTRQQLQTKNHLRKLVPRELSLSKCLPGYPPKRISLDAVGMSQKCQKRTWPHHSITSFAAVPLPRDSLR
jgi:hypothetical protein